MVTAHISFMVAKTKFKQEKEERIVAIKVEIIKIINQEGIARIVIKEQAIGKIIITN